MEHGERGRRVRKTGRRTVGIAVLLVAVTLAAIAARWTWHRDAGQDPRRLGLLYEAARAFGTKKVDQAIELLDRRAAAVAPTPLDRMLRARIAESQGNPDEAMKYLELIPDSDPIGAQARLKAGQVELA